MNIIEKAKINDNSIVYLKKLCEQKLDEYYTAGVPGVVVSRVKDELVKIKAANSEDVYRIYYEFNKVAADNGLFISSRADTGNLMVTFLLGNSPFDPMQPYYYCEECGHYEDFVEIDIVKCSICGKHIEMRGYGLPEIFEFGSNDNPRIRRRFEFHFGDGLRTLLKEVLQSLYLGYEVVDVISPDKSRKVGFSVLPEGQILLRDYPELVAYDMDGNIAICGDDSDIEEKGIILIPAIENFVYNTVKKPSNHYIQLKNYVNQIKTKESIFEEKLKEGFSSDEAYDFVKSKIYEPGGFVPSKIGVLHNKWIWSLNR